MTRFPTFALLAACAVAAPLLACSSTTPEASLYLLRAEPREQSVALGPERIGIGRVVVGAYLMAGPGIVVETEPGVVRPARLHEWAEPLDTGIRWYLRQVVGRSLRTDVGGGIVDRSAWDYAVDVYVSRLHGTMDGHALLESGFVVWRTGELEPASEHVFTRIAPLPAEGYRALVDTERELLGELGREIAAALAPLLDSTPAEPTPGSTTTAP